MRMEEMSRRQRRLEGLSEGGQGTIDGRGLLTVMNYYPSSTVWNILTSWATVSLKKRPSSTELII
jgi:hypothetical protein